MMCNISGDEDSQTMKRQHLGAVSAVKKELDETGTGRLIYMCLSGAHAYGWETKKSDSDYRGIYAADPNKLLGLNPVDNIFTMICPVEPSGLVIRGDVVLFEVKKAIELIIKGNSNVIEWFNNNGRVYSTPEASELKGLISSNITKQMYNTYRGTAEENYEKFIKQGRKEVKKYLYIYRALLAGRVALTEGEIEPNIWELNKRFDIPFVYLLLRYKKNNQELTEKQKLSIESSIEALFTLLDRDYQGTMLPAEPNREAFNKYLLKIRRKSLQAVS